MTYPLGLFGEATDRKRFKTSAAVLSRGEEVIYTRFEQGPCRGKRRLSTYNRLLSRNPARMKTLQHVSVVNESCKGQGKKHLAGLATGEKAKVPKGITCLLAHPLVGFVSSSPHDMLAAQRS